MEALVWLKASINLLLQLTSKRLLRSKWVMWEQETSRPSTRYERSVEGLKIVLLRPWSSLHNDILELIVDRLGVLEFLSFSSTCKEWRSSASSKVRHHHKKDQEEQLRFLLYDKDEFPNCALFDPSSKNVYKKVNVPELGKGVNCIASDKGWLLLYQESNKSMFFLCPFSRAKIDLPNPPHSGFDNTFNWIAAFSSPPTSPDCVVCVCSQIKYDTKTTSGYHVRFMVNVLRRGANEWDDPQEFHTLNHPKHTNGCATFLDGRMHLIDCCLTVVSFSPQDWEWRYIRRWRYHSMCQEIWNQFTIMWKGLDKRKLGLKDNDFITICGTTIQRSGKGKVENDIMCIFNEEYRGGDHNDRVHLIGNRNVLHKPAPKQIGKKYKGVWFQPQLFHLPLNYRL